MKKSRVVYCLTITWDSRDGNIPYIDKHPERVSNIRSLQDVEDAMKCDICYYIKTDYRENKKDFIDGTITEQDIKKINGGYTGWLNLTNYYVSYEVKIISIVPMYEWDY